MNLSPGPSYLYKTDRRGRAERKEGNGKEGHNTKERKERHETDMMDKKGRNTKERTGLRKRTNRKERIRRPPGYRKKERKKRSGTPAVHQRKDRAEGKRSRARTGHQRDTVGANLGPQ